MEQIRFESGLEGLGCQNNERKVWSGQENECTVAMEYDVFKTSLYDAETVIDKIRGMVQSPMVLRRFVLGKEQQKAF